MATFSNMISVFVLIFFASIASSAPAEDLTKCINKFSTYLFEDVSGDKNFFSSPMSAHIVTSLLSYGAKEQTLKDMNKALQITNDDTKKAYKNAIEKMKTQLKFAGMVYVQKGQKLNDDFKEKAADIFYSDVDYIDFTNSNNATAQINSWVEENTDKNIKNFTKPSDVTKQTYVAIVNTLYFKKDWDKKFNPKNTKEEEFYLDDKDQIYVETMKDEFQTNYEENSDLDAQVLQLAFKDKKMSMVFILPKKIEGLKDLKKKLKKSDMQKLVKSLKSADVVVSMPKFQTNLSANFNDALKKLGMGIAFDNKADFEGVLASSDTKLKVDKVIQKTIIDLNEDGVTAAGATGEFTVKKFNFKRSSSSKEFKANHPYFYAVFNEDDQMVFAGQFTGKQ